jgi:hypothetical protein
LEQDYFLIALVSLKGRAHRWPRLSGSPLDRGRHILVIEENIPRSSCASPTRSTAAIWERQGCLAAQLKG